MNAISPKPHDELALLTHTGYYVRICDSLMEPRFVPSDSVLASADAGIQAGDPVVVYLKGQNTIVRDYVRGDAEVAVLKQWNPEIETTVPRSEIIGMHRIIAVCHRL